MEVDRPPQGPERSLRDGRSRRWEKAVATMVPDYYARLDVDPKADRAEIEAALSRKQPAWSMGTRNPKNRHAYQLYLDEIPALRRALLGDPASRAAYDAELAVARRAEREANLDELQRMVRLRAAKGGLGASDRGLLVDEATRLGLNEENLLRLIRPIPSLARAGKRQRRRRDRRRPAGRRPRPVHPPADPRGAGASGLSRPVRRPGRHPRCAGLRHRRPRRCRAPAVDEEGPGHRREDRLARGRRPRAVAPRLAPVAGAIRPDARPRGRGGVRHPGRDSPSRGSAGSTRAPAQALLAEAAALGIAPDRADRLIGRACRRLGVAREAGPMLPPVPMTMAQHAGPGAALSSITLDGQRRGPVHPAAMPELRGRDRDQPGGPQGRVGALPALRGLAAVGLPGLPAHALGRRAAMPVRVPHGTPRAGAPALRGGPAGVPWFDFAGAVEHLDRVLELAPDHAGARNGLARVRQRQAEQGRLRLAYQTARAGGTAGRGPVGGRGLEPRWPTRSRPRSRPPGPS